VPVGAQIGAAALKRAVDAVRARDLRGEVRLALKMTLGGTAAWWLAVELGARRPIFAALVPLVAMTGDPFAAVSVSVSRIVGVFAGVGVGIAFTHVGGGLTLRVALILLTGTLGSVLLKVGDRPNLEVPIAALFMVGVATTQASRLGVQRIWETAIGAAIAVVVSSLLWPPDPARRLSRDLDRLRRLLVDDLTEIADDLATGSGATRDRMDTVRAHSLDAVRDVFELDGARRALRWNPIRRRDGATVAALADRVGLAARVYRHTRTLARDVADTPLRNTALATATRHLADASDRALDGRDPDQPLDRAENALAEQYTGEAWLLATQLRQLHADLEAAVRR
jgi:uncharacterized membrane protein YccC